MLEKPFPAYAGDEPYHFVCYAHEDASAVYSELANLHAAGANLWYDEGISPGSEWPEDLAQAIDGADRLLFFVSPASVGSRHCRNEVQYALDHDKPIVAIHLQPTDIPGGLKLSLGSSQAIMKHQISPEEYERKLSTLLQPGRAILKSVNKPTSRKYGRWASLATIALIGFAFFGISMVERKAPPPSADITQAVADTRPVVAVLPFVNLSSDPQQLFFSDGIAEDIIGGLARHSDLTVKARTSSFAFRDSLMGIADIGQALGASHVLEGSTRRVGNRVRVNVQLVRVTDSSTLWSAKHDEQLEDVLAVQDEITYRILRELRVQFSVAQQPSGREVNPEAYIAYLQGKFHGARNDFSAAKSFYERALELDSEFADAHARLAQLLINQNIFGVEPIEAVREQFVHHNRRAIEIDPSHPDGLTGLALAELWFNHDIEKASNELGALCVQHPNNVDIIIACNITLRAAGYTQLAAHLIDRIVELDPLSPRVYMQRATFALKYRSAADTLVDLEQSEKLGMSVDWVRAQLAIHRRDVDSLEEVLSRDALYWGAPPIARRIAEGQLYLLHGDGAKARAIADEILSSPSYVSLLTAAQAADLKGDATLLAEILEAGLSAGDVGVFLNLRDLSLGPTHDQILKIYGLDRDSIDRLDLSRLLQLIRVEWD